MARYNETDASQIPEVAAFQEVKARYQAFKDANPEFFKYMDELMEEYNSKRQAAEQACRNKQVSSDDFVLYQYQTKYDAEALYNAVGHNTFLELGGKLSQVTKMELDKGRFEAALAANQVPKEVAEQVKKKSPRYKTPDDLKIL